MGFPLASCMKEALISSSRRWVYVADIFPTRTRHYGLATASASQWLFSTFLHARYACSHADSDHFASADFVLSKVTPTLVTDLGYKIFLMFATINIGGMATFALYVHASSHCIARTFADCIAALSRRRRAAVWRRWTSSSGLLRPTSDKPTLRSRSAVRCECIAPGNLPILIRVLRFLAFDHAANETRSEQSIENKV